MNVHECEEGDQGLEQNEEFEGPPDRSGENRSISQRSLEEESVEKPVPDVDERVNVVPLSVVDHVVVGAVLGRRRVHCVVIGAKWGRRRVVGRSLRLGDPCRISHRA